MTKKKAPAFEEQLARLQKITESLETGDLSLDKSLELYKEGVELAAGCRETLEKARHTVRIYTEQGLKDFKPPVTGDNRRDSPDDGWEDGCEED